MNAVRSSYPSVTDCAYKSAYLRYERTICMKIVRALKPESLLGSKLVVPAPALVYVRSMVNIQHVQQQFTQAQAALTDGISDLFAGAVRDAVREVCGPSGQRAPLRPFQGSSKAPLGKPNPNRNPEGYRPQRPTLRTLGPIRFLLELPDGRLWRATRKRDLVRKARKLGISFVEV